MALRVKEIRMRHLLIAASAAALALWVGLGEAEAAPFSLGGLTSATAPAINVVYNQRHPSHYKTHPCTSDEIAALQRYQPQVRWPSSMQCHTYH
jgi:hypothetical protein